MPIKTNRAAAIVCTLLSVFSLLIWIGLLFYAFFLGGSPGPGYERSVPYLYAGIMVLGFSGAALGLAVIVKGLGANTLRKGMLVCSAAISAIGSIPLFLMDLTVVGLFTLAVSILPSALYLILIPKKSGEKE